MAAWAMLVQLSDPHVVAPGALLEGAIDTAALLAQAVATAAALGPAAVVLTGDLTERGRAEEYAQLRTLLMTECEMDASKLTPVLHYDGTPITARFIAGAITAKLGAKNAQAQRSAAGN